LDKNRFATGGKEMKTLFQAYAKYNKNVNQDIISILKTVPQKKLDRKFKTFFPTIYDLLFHILLSDINWMKRFKTLFGTYESVKMSKMGSYDEAKLKEELKGDYEKLFGLRGKMDEEMGNFIDELKDDDYTRMLRYKNYKGEDTEKEMWKVLMQMFNHATHHRGQISGLLDMLGIENDYSAIFPRI
jgi:uncharacterized damage-inducible protein DinB